MSENDDYLNAFGQLFGNSSWSASSSSVPKTVNKKSAKKSTARLEEAKLSSTELCRSAADINNTANHLWVAIKSIFGGNTFLPYSLAAREFSDKLQPVLDVVVKCGGTSLNLDVAFSNLISRDLIDTEDINGITWLKLDLSKEEYIRSLVFADKI